MAANTDLLRKKESNFSTTLNGSITDSATTIALTSTTGLPTDTAITLTIDRVDANGNSLGNIVERVTGVVSGSNLTNCLRGQDGTTAQSHSNAAIVEDIWDGETWNDAVDAILVDHNQDGKHEKVSLAAGGHIYDANANELVKFTQTASAVNELTIANAATGDDPYITVSGGDTDIDIQIYGKGAGIVKINSQYGDIATASDGSTITFDISDGDTQQVTLGGNRTLAISNVKVGQKFTIRLVQDGTGSRTVTWFSTIRWPDGVTPTLTTTANKRDWFGFICTSSGNYDGFILGQNL